MTMRCETNRRHVVVDIETVSLSATEPKGALSASTGRVVCIGLLFDDGHRISEETFIDLDEREIVAAFWGSVEEGDVFVGHNALDFDLPFLRQRSWVNGVRPSRRIDLKRYYTTQVIDTMHLWSNWGATKHISLDVLGQLLGCGGNTGHGTDVSDWWSAGKLERIAGYCRDDVRLTYCVFNRLMFRPLGQRYTSVVPNLAKVEPPSCTDSHMGKVIMFPGPPR